MKLDHKRGGSSSSRGARGSRRAGGARFGCYSIGARGASSRDDARVHPDLKVEVRVESLNESHDVAVANGRLRCVAQLLHNIQLACLCTGERHTVAQFVLLFLVCPICPVHVVCSVCLVCHVQVVRDGGGDTVHLSIAM